MPSKTRGRFFCLVFSFGGDIYGSVTKIGPLKYHKDTLIDARDLTLSYDPGSPLFKDLTFHMSDFSEGQKKSAHCSKSHHAGASVHISWS